MKEPEVPADEDNRLLALEKMRIMDTDQEAVFDSITRMAAEVFGVPISLMSLVDEDRQWFKSSVGLDAKQTPRAISFCGHAINKPEIMVIPDASKDERFQDNPLVTGAPNVRFYAGRPIAAPSGELVGTLCIIDQRPRNLTPLEQSRLESLARWLEYELVQRQARLEGKEPDQTRNRFWELSTDLLCVAGMGMPTVRRIIERHGGSIKVGRPNVGVQFAIEIPTLSATKSETLNFEARR